MAEWVPGPLTGVDLTRTEAFCLPWEMDPWGRVRPMLSVDALQMSAELSAACQSLNITPWLRAGWREATVQVDGELTRLETDWQGLSAKWQRQLIRSKMRGYNPLSQVVGAVREWEGSSTGKAVVMLRPAANGRYVVAVCFMGTGKRFYDWFSNFRLSTPEGVHKGFSQLTDQFEANEEGIIFPETAAELNLETLTLRHILQEMRSPDSRFTLWLSGHSQGGAVMQTYVHRKLLEDGVYPANIVGYGFASPSVMTGEAVSFPEAYPLFHIHNSDDLIPRCGAAVHLGLCLTFEATEALRKACYGWPRDEASVRARLAARPVISRMTDTPSCILQASALLQVLSGSNAAEIADVLGLGDVQPIGKLLEGIDLAELLAGIRRRLEAAYQSSTGTAMPPEELQQAVGRICEGISAVGLQPFFSGLMQLLRYPHRISARETGDYQTPYVWIAIHAVHSLIPSIWQAGPQPVKRFPPKRG